MTDHELFLSTYRQVEYYGNTNNDLLFEYNKVSNNEMKEYQCKQTRTNYFLFTIITNGVDNVKKNYQRYHFTVKNELYHQDIAKDA